MSDRKTAGVLTDLALYAVSALISFALLNNLLKKLDPNEANAKQVRRSGAPLQQQPAPCDAARRRMFVARVARLWRARRLLRACLRAGAAFRGRRLMRLPPARAGGCQEEGALRATGQAAVEYKPV